MRDWDHVRCPAAKPPSPVLGDAMAPAVLLAECRHVAQGLGAPLGGSTLVARPAECGVARLAGCATLSSGRHVASLPAGRAPLGLGARVAIGCERFAARPADLVAIGAGDHEASCTALCAPRRGAHLALAAAVCTPRLAGSVGDHVAAIQAAAAVAAALGGAARDAGTSKALIARPADLLPGCVDGSVAWRTSSRAALGAPGGGVACRTPKPKVCAAVRAAHSTSYAGSCVCVRVALGAPSLGAGQAPVAECGLACGARLPSRGVGGCKEVNGRVATARGAPSLGGARRASTPEMLIARSAAAGQHWDSVKCTRVNPPPPPSPRARTMQRECQAWARLGTSRCCSRCIRLTFCSQRTTTCPDRGTCTRPGLQGAGAE